MAFNLKPTKASDLPKIISQRQIDLEASWWKERIQLMQVYTWKPWSLHHDSFYTTLDGCWWQHHQVQLGPLVIEFTIRRRAL